jgi:hypothetical protein
LANWEEEMHGYIHTGRSHIPTFSEFLEEYNINSTFDGCEVSPEALYVSAFIKNSNIGSTKNVGPDILTTDNIPTFKVDSEEDIEPIMKMMASKEV